MIILVISTILGLMGVIPPEHFEAWRQAMVIELFFDIPLPFVINKIINKIEGV